MARDSEDNGRLSVGALPSRATDLADSDPELALDVATWASVADSLDAAEPPGDRGPVGAGAARIGRYVLEDELGRGGMGAVYRARDPELDRTVALKVVLAGSYASESQKRRFLREARAVAGLEHENIVEVYDLGEHDGGVFYTMPYIDGPSLTRRIADARLEPREAARICAAIARALACAHEAGLVHRDVKPGNILLDGDTPKLMDFGLVKKLGDGDGDATAALTRGGQMLGTPAYMAPEQLGGDIDAIGPATDQYSLGIVLFEMLSGQRPFAGLGSGELLGRMTPNEPPRLPIAGIPADLDLIRRRAMAHAIDERYPDCTTLAGDLERFLAGDPVLAASPGLWRRARRLWRRNWRRLAVVAAVALAVVGGVELRGVWSNWQRERAHERRESAADSRRLAMEARIGDLLARGEADTADALFGKFAAFEDNADTEALARAWLHRGRRLREQGRSEAGLDALATAYGTTADRELQREALIGLAGEFRAKYLWQKLDVVLATIDTRLPSARDDSRVRELRRDARLARRDIAGAAAASASDRGDRTLLTALARATRTEHRAESAEPWDIDGDGRAELALVARGSRTSDIVDTGGPSLSRRARIELPDGGRILASWQAVPGMSPATALLAVGREWRVIALGSPPGEADDTSYTIQKKWPNCGWDAGLSADLDGDGRLENYVSCNYRLYRLEAGADGRWRRRGVHRATNAAESRVTGLVAADLDGDGVTELFVGSRGWRSYDIRVFRAAATTGAGGDLLRLVHRKRLGIVDRMAIVEVAGERQLAALQLHHPDAPLNRRVYAADEPQGAAQGIHFFVFEDGRLKPRGLVPLPLVGAAGSRHRRDNWRELPRVHLRVGDLDGDGRDDIVLGAPSYHWTFVYRQNNDGSFTEHAIADLEFLQLAQLDDDPALEMVVSLPERDFEVWVLGAGDERLPALPRTERAATESGSPLVRRELGARWQRAEDLHALGLVRTAAAQMREVSTHAVGTIDESRALYRGGEFLEAGGALADAAELYERAAATPGLAATAWEAAVRVHLADHRWQAALRAADERRALPGSPETVNATARRLRQRLAAEPLSFDFRRHLDPSWRVLSPIQVRRDPRGRGLRLSTAGSSPLMKLPLRRTGGSLRIAFDFELERMDWASYLWLFLDDGDERPQGFRLAYRGGGDVYQLEVSCPGLTGPFIVSDLDKLLGRPLRLIWEYAEDGSASCELATGGVNDERAVYGMEPPLAFDSVFALTMQLQPQVDIPATTTALLQRVELRGARIAAPPADGRSSLERVHRELAMARPDSAREALEGAATARASLRTDPDWLLARAIVAEELGDPATVRSALAAALARDIEMGGYAAALFRHHLDRFETPLRAILGDRYYLLAAAYIVPTVRAHLREGRMLGLLRRHLNGLDSLPGDIGPLPDIRFRDESGPLARLWLQVWRGHAWRRADRVMFAIRDLERVRGLGRELLAESRRRRGREDTRYLLEVRLLLAEVGRQLASCHLARGESDRAMDTLLQSLDDAPAPEIAADIISARGDFKPLHTHPRWRELERIRAP